RIDQPADAAHLTEQLARDVAFIFHTCPAVRKDSALNFVLWVVNRLRTVLQLAEPAVHPQRPARFDASDAALAQPHERDSVSTVEQFGLDAARAPLGVGLDAAKRADHVDFLPTLAVDGPLRASARGLVGQLGVPLLRVFCQPTSEPAQNSSG